MHDCQTLFYRLFVVLFFNRAGFIVFQIGTIRIDFPVINALFLEIVLKGLVSKHDTDGTDFTHRGSDKGSAGGGSQPEMGTTHGTGHVGSYRFGRFGDHFSCQVHMRNHAARTVDPQDRAANLRIIGNITELLFQAVSLPGIQGTFQDYDGHAVNRQGVVVQFPPVSKVRRSGVGGYFIIVEPFFDRIQVAGCNTRHK